MAAKSVETEEKWHSMVRAVELAPFVQFAGPHLRKASSVQPSASGAQPHVTLIRCCH